MFSDKTVGASLLAPTVVGRYQCNLSRGSVPRPILLPSINIAVRNEGITYNRFIPVSYTHLTLPTKA